MLSLKILLLASIFVVSGGSLYSEYFKEHKRLLILASIVVLLSTYYLIDSIYNDLKEVFWSNSSETHEVLNSTKDNYNNKDTDLFYDNDSSLVWLAKDDGVIRNWNDAKEYCETTQLDNYEFKLPTIGQLFTLYKKRSWLQRILVDNTIKFLLFGLAIYFLVNSLKFKQRKDRETGVFISILLIIFISFIPENKVARLDNSKVNLRYLQYWTSETVENGVLYFDFTDREPYQKEGSKDLRHGVICVANNKTHKPKE